MSSSSEANPTSRELLETRDDAVVAVQRILAGNESRFEMVPFQKYNTIVTTSQRIFRYISYQYLTFGRMALVSLCTEWCIVERFGVRCVYFRKMVDIYTSNLC